MGLDRFSTFLSKSIGIDTIDEVEISSNIKKIISNHVLFDLNFLIYQEILEIENEINDILKTILCLPYICSNIELLENQLKNIIGQTHWQPYFSNNEISYLFDGFNEDEIIKKFQIYIMGSTQSNIEMVNQNITIIELVIFEKISNTIIEIIDKTHHMNFIQSISIFFDGIPSISKVIEQRRRRIRNHVESVEKKKLFKIYFDNLEPNYKKLCENIAGRYNQTQTNGSLVFDYFKWVKNRFSIDKSIGPNSNFIKHLEILIECKMKKIYPKISINVSGGKINGESDLKIFQYIANENLLGDCCIHTTDSDLIHQSLVQQSYYKITGKDINFTVCKYIKNINHINWIQILEIPLIIKNLMDLYNGTNGLKTNNYKIIWDLCLLFYLFGNDHLPSSLEIGPELGLEFYMKKHFQSLGKNNVVNMKKTYITVDLENLKLFLEKINETKNQNITKIILQRYFKISFNLVNLFVEKLNLDFDSLQVFLKKFHIYRGLGIESVEFSNLDDHDLRKLFIISNENICAEDYLNLSVFNLSEDNRKLFMDSIKLIEDNIDYFEKSFNGLILYIKPLSITNDPYQDLYNYIVEKSSTNSNKLFPSLYDHFDIHTHILTIRKTLNNQVDFNSNDYLKKIYHLVVSQFGNMEDFHSDNTEFYKYHNAPSLSELIEFININQNEKLTKKWLHEIKTHNLSSDKYLNFISHHLIISPFMSIGKISNETATIFKELKHIDNLWIEDINSFDYRKINIDEFLNEWNEALIRINLISQNDKNETQLVNLSIDLVS